MTRSSLLLAVVAACFVAAAPAAAQAVSDHAPTCSDASAGTPPATTISIPVSCTDPDGDTVVLLAVDGPSHGRMTLSGLTATYTPVAGFSGDDTFRVKGSDGGIDGGNRSAPVTVTVHVGAGSASPLRLSASVAPRRDHALPFKFTFSGRLTPAAGATCSGKVVVTVRHGKKTVAKKTATVASSCTWKAVVTFKNRTKLGSKRSGTLTAKARYGGNAAMSARSAKALTVRYG